MVTEENDTGEGERIVFVLSDDCFKGEGPTGHLITEGGRSATKDEYPDTRLVASC
uniref:Polyketide synthase n=1 Tax=Peronospora matthiolae TaxID=2874970 RepID=A0AAV1T5A6_9STRA